MEENKRKAMEKRMARMQSQAQSQTQQNGGLTADEIPDDVGSRHSQANRTTNGDIDSDEEDMADEMWNDLMSSQVTTSTQKPNSGRDESSRTSTTQKVLTSGSNKSETVKKSAQVHSQEYDDETDDDDDYEDYLDKLKLENEIVVVSKSKDDNVSTNNESSKAEINASSSQSLEDEQSLSILNYDDSPPSTNEQDAPVDDEVEQSQSILGPNNSSELDSTGDQVAADGPNESTNSSQKSSNLGDDPINDTDASGSQGGKESSAKSLESQEKEEAADEEATCLPEADPLEAAGHDDEATCLPDDDDEMETQLPEQDDADNEQDIAEQDTEALPSEDDALAGTELHKTETQCYDTAEADTMAQDIAEQDTQAVPAEEENDTEQNKTVAQECADTAEAETMEFEPMDTAEAETQLI